MTQREGDRVRARERREKNIPEHTLGPRQYSRPRCRVVDCDCDSVAGERINQSRPKTVNGRNSTTFLPLHHAGLLPTLRHLPLPRHLLLQRPLSLTSFPSPSPLPSSSLLLLPSSLPPPSTFSHQVLVYGSTLPACLATRGNLIARHGVSRLSRTQGRLLSPLTTLFLPVCARARHTRHGIPVAPAGQCLGCLVLATWPAAMSLASIHLRRLLAMPTEH